MAMTLGDIIVNVKSDTSHLTKGFSNAEKRVNSSAKTMNNSIKILTAGLIGLGAVDLVGNLIKQADAMTLINTRLKLATKSTKELTKAQKELFDISQEARVGFSSTVDLFERITRSTRDYATSQKEVIDLTKTINKAMVISGGTAQSMNAAIIQLGQAFSADFQAVGQELASIREQAPRLYQALLEGTNLSSKAFKKHAEDGKLSTQIIIDALKSQSEAVATEFEKVNLTVDQAQTKIKNSSLKIIGSFDDITGASSFIAESISDISKSIDDIDPQKLEDFANDVLITIEDLEITASALNAEIEKTVSLFDRASNPLNEFNIELLNIQNSAVGVTAFFAAVNASLENTSLLFENAGIQAANWIKFLSFDDDKDAFIAANEKIIQSNRLQFKSLEEIGNAGLEAGQKIRKSFAEAEIARAESVKNLQAVENIGTKQLDTQKKILDIKKEISDTDKKAAAAALTARLKEIELDFQIESKRLEKRRIDAGLVSSLGGESTDKNLQAKIELLAIDSHILNQTKDIYEIEKLRSDVIATHLEALEAELELTEDIAGKNILIKEILETKNELAQALTAEQLAQLQIADNLAKKTQQEKDNKKQILDLDYQISLATRELNGEEIKRSEIIAKQIEYLKELLLNSNDIVESKKIELDLLRKQLELEQSISQEKRASNITGGRPSGSTSDSLVGMTFIIPTQSNFFEGISEQRRAREINEQRAYEEAIKRSEKAAEESKRVEDARIKEYKALDLRLRLQGAITKEDKLKIKRMEAIANLEDRSNEAKLREIYLLEDIQKALEDFGAVLAKSINNVTNAISGSISGLKGVSSQAGFGVSVSYQTALQEITASEIALIANPLSTEISSQFTEDYNQFIAAATNFLADTSSFESSRELEFNRAVISAQAAGFQVVASDTVDLLETTNSLLETIAMSLKDGILSDEEKATIAKVATDINNKNDILLGNDTKLATGTDLIGSNSVSAWIAKLMGGKNEGISLTSIANGMNDLEVLTNLDEKDLSNIDIFTQGTVSAIANLEDAIYSIPQPIVNVTTGTTTTTTGTAEPVDSKSDRLDDIMQKISYNTALLAGDYGDLTFSAALAVQETLASLNALVSSGNYAVGGFTGSGFGSNDNSGFKPAGIVHENEWVAPEWMIKANPSLFNALELSRSSGKSLNGYSDGGSVSNQTLGMVGANDYQELYANNVFNQSNGSNSVSIINELEAIRIELNMFRIKNFEQLRDIDTNTQESRFTS